MTHALVLAFDAAPVAQLVTDAERRLAHVNQEACRLTGIGDDDIGKALGDLALARGPFDLLGAFDRADADGASQRLGAAELVSSGGRACVVEAEVVPLAQGGMLVLLADVTAQRRLESELELSRGELQTFYEALQTTVEELESTNEELQSTHAELDTIDGELRGRSIELDRVSGFLGTTLASLEASVVLLDHEQRVVVWNAHAEAAWSFSADEASGRRLADLDFGLDRELLDPAVRAALGGGTEREEVALEAVDRHGRRFRCTAIVAPARTAAGEVAGVVLLVREASPPDPARL